MEWPYRKFGRLYPLSVSDAKTQMHRMYHRIFHAGIFRNTGFNSPPLGTCSHGFLFQAHVSELLDSRSSQCLPASKTSYCDFPKTSRLMDARMHEVLQHLGFGIQLPWTLFVSHSHENIRFGQTLDCKTGLELEKTNPWNLTHFRKPWNLSHFRRFTSKWVIPL